MNKLTRCTTCLWFLLLLSTAAYAEEAPVKPEPSQVDQAWDLIQKGDLEQAKKLLQEFIAANKDLHVPYVEDNTLHMYADSQAEIIAFSQIYDATEPKITAFRDRYYPWFKDLRKNQKWLNISFLKPELPKALQALAYIAIEEKDLAGGEEYLKKSIDAWPQWPLSYAELMYIYIGQGKFDEAKKMAQHVLENVAIFKKEDKARILKHLGYIAIEENQLDQAEKYYREVLDLIPNEPKALEELEYIQLKREKR